MRTYSLYVGFNEFSVNGKVVKNPFLFGAEKETIEAVIEENPILKFLDNEDINRLYAEFDEAEKEFRDEFGDTELRNDNVSLDDAYAELGGIWSDDGWHCIYYPESLDLPGVNCIAITARER